VLYNGGVREAPGNGLGTFLVGGEVGGDGFWQIESHGSSLQVGHTGAVAPDASWTPAGTDADNSALSFFSSDEAPRAGPRHRASAGANRPDLRAGGTGDRERRPRVVAQRHLRSRGGSRARRRGPARRGAERTRGGRDRHGRLRRTPGSSWGS